MTACPVCGLTDGFHDGAEHGRRDVPAEVLIAGERRDMLLIERECVDNPVLLGLVRDLRGAGAGRAMFGIGGGIGGPA